MIDRGVSTAHEMVLAFLRAEVDSARFGQLYRVAMARRGVNRKTLVDDADLNDADANVLRSLLLREARGYGSGSLLFAGFPDDVQWRRVELDSSEIGNLRYANFPEWVALSGGTRRVDDGAKNVESDLCMAETRANIRAVAGAVVSGRRFPKLIAVTSSRTTSDLVLLEGHTRATAYALTRLPENTDALIGYASGVSDWRWV